MKIPAHSMLQRAPTPEQVVRDYLRALEEGPAYSAPTMYTKGKVAACHKILAKLRKAGLLGRGSDRTSHATTPTEERT